MHRMYRAHTHTHAQRAPYLAAQPCQHSPPHAMHAMCTHASARKPMRHTRLLPLCTGMQHLRGGPWPGGMIRKGASPPERFETRSQASPPPAPVVQSWLKKYMPGRAVVRATLTSRGRGERRADPGTVLACVVPRVSRWPRKSSRRPVPGASPFQIIPPGHGPHVAGKFLMRPRLLPAAGHGGVFDLAMLAAGCLACRGQCVATGSPAVRATCVDTPGLSRSP